MSLSDIQGVEGQFKGKSREDTSITDEEMAFNLQAEDLTTFVAALQDHRFARTLDEALQTDIATLGALSIIHQGEQDDHLAALALQRGEELPSPTHSQQLLQLTKVPEFGSATTSNNGISSVVEPDSYETDNRSGPSRLPYDGRQLAAPEETLSRVDCIICGDLIGQTERFHAPCSHWYCRGCLVNLVEASTRDETLHPLQCCRQPFLVANTLQFLPPELRSRFHEKSAEFATSPTSRLYCPNQTCSAFLGPSSEHKSEVTCTHCNTRVCSVCKNKVHPGEDCAENARALLVKSLASEMGWQTCPGCHAIVELQQGCYHMTCRCSTQFCYLCAAQWKTCDCRQWDDRRLLDNAEGRVDPVQQVGALPVERVCQRRAELQGGQGCLEHDWRFRLGGGRCEECREDFPMYLMAPWRPFLNVPPPTAVTSSDMEAALHTIELVEPLARRENLDPSQKGMRLTPTPLLVAPQGYGEYPSPPCPTEVKWFATTQDLDGPNNHKLEAPQDKKWQEERASSNRVHRLWG
ncbi:hypothetical protein K503DRAFT_782672 [Rhizopogon vinicolor AM-OR11-026]|uniref:RBR-type E3 ubiquitin transferase n=1 Tax=Rhizopogon vinicolor AM-OR11-026 TaxID=1314800 RepID=A0A1B7N1M0_9AGAM|nr:hypothetical protein K503DRAFT_782672 [Rhizopogon vinicolor AM-OR11-026]